MKKILITGASGFIGTKVAIFFLSKGFEVLGWNRCETKCPFPVINVDMLEIGEVINALDSYRPDYIIHCAGCADVAKSVTDPFSDYEGNVTILHNLLFVLHKLGLDNTRVVFLSSAGIYGNPKTLPINERTQPNPLSPYAIHKVMCEELCEFCIKNYGMNIKVARIFSAYGEGLKKQIFWDMYKKYKTTGRLVLFGTGNESRDYIHIDDVVQSLYLLAMTDYKGCFFNVANGEEITIKSIAELFTEIMGLPFNIVDFNGVVREGDPLNWKADISRIKQIGYNKTIDISTGLTRYVKWVSSLER